MEALTRRRWRNRLPHWEIENGIYFVTVRCAGSLPSGVREKIKELQIALDAIDSRDDDFQSLQRQIFLTAEKYLDRGEGFAPFKETKACQALAEHFETLESGWLLTDWVIMPNHIHFLVIDAGSSFSLGEAMRRFKGRSARICNQALGRRGSFWQRDWFDRWVRGPAELNKIRQYIAQNPVKAGFASTPENYPWWRCYRPD